MKISTTIRLGIAAALITVGCLLLLYGFPKGSLLIGMTPLLTMPPTELTRPMPRRRLGLILGALFAIILLFVAVQQLVGGSAFDLLERTICHPAGRRTNVVAHAAGSTPPLARSESSVGRLIEASMVRGSLTCGVSHDTGAID